MAQKNFWGWLNLGRDGQPIDGESGSGQQYFATKERKKSFFWGVVYRVADIAICVLMLPLLVVLTIIEQLHLSACRLLDWLERKAG